MTSCNESKTLGDHAELLLCLLRYNADNNLDIDYKLEVFKRTAIAGLLGLYTFGQQDDILPPPLTDMLHDLIVFGIQHNVHPLFVDSGVDVLEGQS